MVRVVAGGSWRVENERSFVARKGAKQQSSASACWGEGLTAECRNEPIYYWLCSRREGEGRTKAREGEYRGAGVFESRHLLEKADIPSEHFLNSVGERTGWDAWGDIANRFCGRIRVRGGRER